MALLDSLPNRPLTTDEAHELSTSDAIDELAHAEGDPGDVVMLFILSNETMHSLMYADGGWERLRSDGPITADAFEEAVANMGEDMDIPVDEQYDDGRRPYSNR